jgi:signal peptidase I
MQFVILIYRKTYSLPDSIDAIDSPSMYKTSNNNSRVFVPPISAANIYSLDDVIYIINIEFKKRLKENYL